MSGGASASEATRMVRILELESKVKELEAENNRLKSAATSDPLKDEIAEFGECDYRRLRNMDSSDVKRISVVSKPHLVTLRNLLKEAIYKSEIKLMDKESGMAFTASGVVGFDGNSLLIFNER